jgi:CHAD domain-containing protein
MDDKAIPLPPLLELTSSQLEVALQNAASQVERLAQSVAAFARLGAEMCASPDAAVAAQGVRVTAEAQRAMFAMQFHDQLAQRVEHVRDALGDLHDAMAAPAPPRLESLLAVIRGRYTMEDERRLFDVMLQHYSQEPHAPCTSDTEALRSSVELF